MIILNFISPSQKEANRFQKNYSLIKRVMITFLIILFVVVGLLQLTQILLKNKLASITTDTEALKQQTEEEKPVDLEQTVQSFNKLLKNIERVQSEYNSWSEILIKTASLVPTGIQLSSFTINKENSNFKITGKANYRDDLLNFKNNLEESDFFAEIESPISNLLLKEDINFELNGKIVLNSNHQKN